jgi:hypothetical protein
MESAIGGGYRCHGGILCIAYSTTSGSGERENIRPNLHDPSANLVCNPRLRFSRCAFEMELTNTKRMPASHSRISPAFLRSAFLFVKNLSDAVVFALMEEDGPPPLQLAGPNEAITLGGSMRFNFVRE